MSKREQIITQALNLFYYNGFNATGVDSIIRAAGVSKKTLYHHFHSKNDLVLATLRRRDEQFRSSIIRETERRSDCPKGRLMAIFDVIAAWCRQDGFAGCLFINASAEFNDIAHPCHIACAEHKRLVCDYITELATAAGAQKPKELAKQLDLLIEGAIVNAHIQGDLWAAERAKPIAQALIANQMPQRYYRSLS